MSWQPLEQGLFSKKAVGMFRRLTVVPGQAEAHLVNGLIMDIFNIFIAQKLRFEKRDMPPMDLGVKFDRKDLLFVYSVGAMILLALPVRARKGKDLEAVDLVLAPAQAALSQEGRTVSDLLDKLPDPYHRS